MIEVRRVADLCEATAFVEELLDNLEAVCNGVIDGLLRRFGPDIDAIGLSEDYGGEHAMLLSPAMWRRFIKPRLARMTGRIRRGGKKVYIHSCGHVTPICASRDWKRSSVRHTRRSTWTLDRYLVGLRASVVDAAGTASAGNRCSYSWAVGVSPTRDRQGTSSITRRARNSARVGPFGFTANFPRGVSTSQHRGPQKPQMNTNRRKAWHRGGRGIDIRPLLAGSSKKQIDCSLLAFGT